MKNETNKKQPSAGRIISIIQHHAQIYFKHEFKDFPLGHAQIFTLHHLLHNNGISQKQLTQFSKLDKGSITSQLNYLEKNGYIRRSRSKEDARISNLFITEKTIEVKDDIQSVFRGWTEALLCGFDDLEKEKAMNILIRIADNADGKIREIKNEK